MNEFQERNEATALKIGPCEPEWCKASLYMDLHGPRPSAAIFPEGSDMLYLKSKCKRLVGLASRILATVVTMGLVGATVIQAQDTSREPPTPRSSGSSCESVPVDSVNDANSLAKALQGRIAGLNIFSSTGHVGSGSTVRLRGNRSAARSNDPLIVIDDIPIRSIETVSITRYAEQTRTLNPLDFVDPVDVVRVEVLRGPAATTLYGMEASNGAIRIYTKRGERKGGGRAKTEVRCPS